VSRTVSISVPVFVADGSNSIVARSVAKFTEAFATPGWRFNVRSIRFAHAAHVMPVIGRSTRSQTSPCASCSAIDAFISSPVLFCRESCPVERLKYFFSIDVPIMSYANFLSGNVDLNTRHSVDTAKRILN
jgi:hypothetical protein